MTAPTPQRTSLDNEVVRTSSSAASPPTYDEKVTGTEKTAGLGENVRRTSTTMSPDQHTTAEQTTPKKPWWNSVRVAGSATQIVIAAALAIAIGMAVTTTVDDIPNEASTILAIPGRLWLRALKAVVLPLIVCAMILAVQRLRAMAGSKFHNMTSSSTDHLADCFKQVERSLPATPSVTMSSQRFSRLSSAPS